MAKREDIISKEKVVEKKTPEQEVQVQKADLTYVTVKVEKQDIRNTLGEEVDLSKYFIPNHENISVAPNYFNRSHGYPISQNEFGFEEMIEVFNKVFDVKDGFLLFKQRTKEVYSVLVPLRYAKELNEAEEANAFDYQIHAISFIKEGGFNIQTFENKLKSIKTINGYEKTLA